MGGGAILGGAMKFMATLTGDVTGTATYDGTATTRFYKCLSSKIGVFSAAIVTAGGFIGAWVKYPKQMWRRL
jgi:hypothetical protein